MLLTPDGNDVGICGTRPYTEEPSTGSDVSVNHSVAGKRYAAYHVDSGATA